MASRAKLFVLIPSLVLAPAAAAHATTLYTPPLWMDLDGGTAVCQLANVGSDAVTGRIRAFNSSGSLAADSGDVPVAPGQVRVAQVDIGLDGSDQVYCRFDVASRKSKVRTSSCIKNGDDRLACLEGR